MNTSNNTAPQSAFTIIELIIVIAVVLILSATAISGTGGLIRSLRFTNTFNKMVFMVQRARSQALSGKDTAGAKGYGVQFEKSTASTPDRFRLFQDLGSGNSEIDGDEEIIETIELPITAGLGVTLSKGGQPPTPCLDSAVIYFANTSAQTSLSCDGGTTNSLTLGASENAAGATRTKTFTINSSAGIPQTD